VMDQQIINLYDSYTHSQISRKDFMKKLAILAGSTALALTVLPLLENNYAAAASIYTNDDLIVENVTFTGVEGDMKAVLAKPKGKKEIRLRSCYS
jgi:carboxymethylenebutenolidase